jgi:choline dehydrogenase-like flavoprotein
MSEMPESDVIVVGSGLSGLHCAQTLVEAGVRVLMLDIGESGYQALEEGAALSFDERRRTDPAQYRIFLGDDLSGIGSLKDKTGHASAMTSGRRSFVVRGQKTLLPVEAKDVSILQSTAQGGLSEAWGSVCDIFTAEECRVVGIPDDLSSCYREVVARIGVSGNLAGHETQAPLSLDDTAYAIQERYRIRDADIRRLGYTITQPALAILSRDTNGRRKNAYRDMDYWDNIEGSIYRGHFTLELLNMNPCFTYVPHVLVERVEENEGGVIVYARAVDTRSALSYCARSVALAAGAVNTTRIMARSKGLVDVLCPIVLKNNYLVPCLQWSRLGEALSRPRHSLCQLTMTSTYDTNVVPGTYVQLYSYNSLLLHKLIPFVPLPAPVALTLFAAFAPALVLADIRFSSTIHPTGTSILKSKDGLEYLEIAYPDSALDREKEERGVGRVKKALRALGLVPLSMVRNQFGATSHYAGGVPYADAAGTDPMTTNRLGQVRGMERVFIVDSASWRALPAKPSALTIMANAIRIGTHIRKQLVSH